MSKQSEAKQAQGYAEKVKRICCNCKHFGSIKTEESGYMGVWYKESNIRCTLGDFAIKKTATCNKFEVKK
jgi:hypothetical protein